MSVLHEILAASNKEPTTKEAYRLAIDRWESFAGTSPANWTPGNVDAWRDALRRRLGLGANTVNKHLHALRYVSRRYAALGHGPDFAAGAEGLRGVAPTPRRALSVDEVRGMVAACHAEGGLVGCRDAAILTVGVRTGLRASALSSLSWSRIDLDRAEVREKNRPRHVVILDQECQAALARWQHATGAERGAVWKKIRYRKDGMPVLAGVMTRRDLHRVISTRGLEAGVEGVHAHLLRHTFVSWLMDAGVPYHRVMHMTGHRNLATLSKYAHDLAAETDPVGSYLPPLQ